MTFYYGDKRYYTDMKIRINNAGGGNRTGRRGETNKCQGEGGRERSRVLDME